MLYLGQRNGNAIKAAAFITESSLKWEKRPILYSWDITQWQMEVKGRDSN